MGAAAAAQFDAELRAALVAMVESGELALEGDRLALTVASTIFWGAPLHPASVVP